MVDTYLRHTSLHSSSSRAHRYKPRHTYQQYTPTTHSIIVQFTRGYDGSLYTDTAESHKDYSKQGQHQHFDSEGTMCA